MVGAPRPGGPQTGRSGIIRASSAFAELLIALPSTQAGMHDPDCVGLAASVGYQMHCSRSGRPAVSGGQVVDIISLPEFGAKVYIWRQPSRAAVAVAGRAQAMSVDMQDCHHNGMPCLHDAQQRSKC